MTDTKETWTTIIKPKNNLLDLNLKDLWKYRDLTWLFIKRDFVTFYKQTILGPLWFIIQPIFTSATYLLIFGTVAKISTDEIPPMLFYMSGVLNWSYFSDCLNKVADTFASNSHIFGKIYFPRLAVPISNAIFNVFKYIIQFVLFLVFYFVFWFRGAPVHPNWMVLLTPVILLYISILSMGFGLLISAITTKYRDLKFALSFAIQLWMYATPIVYPLSLVPARYKMLMELNPVSPAIELFRMAYFGTGTINPLFLGINICFTFLILFIGIIVFNKTEKTFMDTV